MGFNEFLSSIFGNKATRDMKEIKPWVDKVISGFIPLPRRMRGVAMVAARTTRLSLLFSCITVAIDRVAPTLSSAMRIRAPNACTAAPLN